jgi:hypothetical protein
VNPGSVDLAPDGTLYGFSTSFGSDPFSGTVFSVDASASSPSIEVFTNPYAGSSPLTPDPEFGGGIDDVQFIDFAGTSYLVVSNGGGSEQEWGTIEVDSESVELLFEQADLEANLGVSGYDAFTAPLAANPQGEVFVASGGFGPNYIAKVSDAPPLPVEMAGFDAVKSGSSVELTWQTASEMNNAGFQVQRKRKTDGAEWTQIGFREGAGTTERTQTYRFTDATPPFEADALTYRLKQVDLDGSTSFSKPVILRQTVDQVTLRAPFPNPVRDRATVQFAVPERQDVSLRLYDVLGRRVTTLVAGKQMEGRQEVQIDGAGLPSGTYFLRLRADGQVHTERVTVVR